MPQVDMQPVKSSNIEAIGHDLFSRMLFVRFKSGKTYAYPSVGPDKHRALMAADSVGSHFAKHIKPRHIGTPL